MPAGSGSGAPPDAGGWPRQPEPRIIVQEAQHYKTKGYPTSSRQWFHLKPGLHNVMLITACPSFPNRHFIEWLASLAVAASPTRLGYIRM